MFVMDEFPEHPWGAANHAKVGPGVALGQMLLIGTANPLVAAGTGEFERLKEFGIKASKEGDNVSFTFRGVTTTVKNSAAEIEGYLIKLGETNFGGAMADRMATLEGSLAVTPSSQPLVVDSSV